MLDELTPDKDIDLVADDPLAIEQFAHKNLSGLVESVAAAKPRSDQRTEERVRNPIAKALILPYILQTETKSKVNAF